MSYQVDTTELEEPRMNVPKGRFIMVPYCTSHPCTRAVCGEKQISVPRGTGFCPDCGYAVVWRREAFRVGRPRVSNEARCL